MPCAALVIAAAAAEADRAAAALRGAGVAALSATDDANLVPAALQAAPAALVWLAEVADSEWARRLAALQASLGVPAVLICASIDDRALADALAAGLHACWIAEPAREPPDLAALLRLAQARFAHEQGLHSRIDAAERGLKERKLLDRAKGVLMRARPMSEDEAFAVLRAASMRTQQRVGEVSQRVVDAAQQADAVNRAGQLRMLSQRIVKLAALRAAGVEPAATRDLLDASVTRADAQIAALVKTRSARTQAALQQVSAAWQALHAALGQRVEVSRLYVLDALAETLLGEADALTTAVQAQGLTQTLRVVNLSGRQRMLAQRLAKLALLASMLDEPQATRLRAAAADTDAQFHSALVTLAGMPIATPEIRDGLDAADRCWQQLRGAVHDAHSASGRRTIAHASEQLLDLFDDLTARYAHSLQVILA